MDHKNKLKALKDSKFFNDLNSKNLEAIVSESEHIYIEQDKTLFNSGENNFAGIFYLLSGRINLINHLVVDNSEMVKEVHQNEIFNSLSVFYEDSRSNTAIAIDASRLLFFPKSMLIKQCKNSASFDTFLNNKITSEFNREKLFRILFNVYAKDVEYNILREIMNSGEWLSLRDNAELFCQGDPSDSMYFLVKGFLKVFIIVDKKLKEVGVIKEGEVIGEMGLLSDEQRSASIYAIRDSVLFKITKQKFDILMRSNPSVLFALSKQIILRFKKNQNVKTDNTDTIFLTLLYLSKNRDDRVLNCGFGSLLNNSLNQYESTYFLSKEKAERELSVKNINQKLRLEQKYFPLDNLIDRISKKYKYIILESELEDTPWTKLCNDLSDKFLFLLNPEEGIQNTKILALMNDFQKKTPRHLLVDRQLVICHKDKNNYPKKTIQFLDALKPISNHFHIDVTDESDFSRIARTIANKSIGVAFGGGGARGLAHIGAYKALLDNGIPIDQVCGTSAGSLMAGIVASGFSIEKIIKLFQDYTKAIPIKWNDYQLPYSSILDDKKLLDAYYQIFGNRKIEDLWLSMFCCAVNITTAELKVFNRGKISKAIRASSSLPGLLAPVVDKGSLYVDGGLINNMPGDILKKTFNSKLISINVSPEVDLIPNFNKYPSQNALVLKKIFSKKKFKNSYDKLNIPTLGGIMVRSIMTGSAKKTNEVASLSEIYLNIPTDGFSMLNYGNLSKLIELGYKYANNHLKKYDVKKLLDLRKN